MADQPDDEVLAELLSECEAALEYQFHDRQLLQRCLTHASIAKTRLASNERLEFLGDAILGAVVCEILYHRFPEKAEGDLTRIKSSVVSRNTCAKVCRKLGLDQFLLLGKGLATYDSVPQSIMAAVAESLIAGVYLDGGMEAARRLIERLMLPEIELAARSSHGRNYKSVLQQLAQKTFGETPVYRLLDEKGPDHSKCFNVSAVIGTRAFPAAWGASKKEAEQNAAQKALLEIEREVAEAEAEVQ